MGGQDSKKQKTAKYPINCRFNKIELCKRIEIIGKRKKDISVSKLDAIDFINKINNPNTLVYLDPPYYKQGKALYMNFYSHSDHENLAKCLKKNKKFKWILSYDNVNEIRNLYSKLELYEFKLFYTAQVVKRGSELLTLSSNLNIPKTKLINEKIKLNKL